jgi:signal transduction histidine kinase
LKHSNTHEINNINSNEDFKRHFLDSALIGILKVVNQSLSVPYSVVALPEDNQQWNKFSFGALSENFHQLDSFYSKILNTEQLCTFENAIGIKLKNRDQKTIGVFCVIDHQNRKFSVADVELFESLKNQIELIFQNVCLMQFVSDQNEIILQNSRLASLGQMTAEIVHEINNPLSIIQARLDLLQMQATKNELTSKLAEDSIKKMLVTVERVAQIINGVKSFSRNVNHDPFENMRVADMLDYSLSFCADRLKFSSVKLIKDAIPEHLQINCRSVQISQVIVNLINNAIDAASLKTDRWIRISVQDLGDRTAIQVIDCGNGIESKVLEKLFNPFFTTKCKGQGTGLGLSISKSIVEAHQGTLEYAELAGHTSFVIQLPKVI